MVHAQLFPGEENSGRLVALLRQQAKALAKDGVGDFDESLAKATPEGVTDDIGDESGDSFVEVAELDSEAFDDSLGIEELIKGFPE